MSFFPVYDIAYDAWSTASCDKSEEFTQLSEDQKDALFDEIIRLAKTVTAAIECGDPRLLSSYLNWLARAASNKYFTLDDWHSILENIIDGFSKAFKQLTGSTSPEIHSLRTQALAFLEAGEGGDNSNTSVHCPFLDIDRFATALMHGNRAFAYAEITRLREEKHYSFKEIASSVIQPAMYRIGDLWERGQVSITQEHLASSLSHDILRTITSQAPKMAQNGNRAVLACVADNSHYLGLQMIDNHLQIQGFQTDFLGPNSSTDAILHQIDRHQPGLVALSASLSTHLPNLKRTISAIRCEFATNRPYLAVGGLVLNAIGISARDLHADITASGVESFNEVLH